MHEGDIGQADLRGVLPADTSLRGYEVKSILGQGAFGITYRARDLTLDRDVAIKEYLPTLLALREGRTTVLPRSPHHAEEFAWGRERFLDEARTLARLDRTPAIVQVHDFLEANGTAYMVMGLVEGETLGKHLLREQRLTPEAVDRLLFPLLDGLEEVHATGFLHRDIKPANIMIDAHGRPTLIDFGASRAAMAERSTTLTAVFTPGYAASEQFASVAHGQWTGPWTDIYGLAATLYHAITGRIPPSSIDRILKDTYQPLGKLKPEGYAPVLLAGIDAGMAMRVDERPQSIAEWRHLLLPQTATRIARKPARAYAATRIKKAGITIRGPALWGTIMAALALLAGGGYLAFTANPIATVSTAALSLTTEQLEQALAERRKVDALAAEKRRLEDEARRKAETEAEAKRRADLELENARQARRKAEQELAQLKAEIEARRQADAGQRDQAAVSVQRAAEEVAQRKAEAEAATLRQAEEEAAKKAAADAAAKRQADRALAMAETQRKQAEADALAAASKAAEAVERSLRLQPADRQRLQVALTSLGFDTRGDDGVFGPRSREMIARWQAARNRPQTGFLTRVQQQALLKEAAATLSKYDAQKKAEEDVKVQTIAVAPVSAPDSRPPASADGLWRGIYECGRDGNFKPLTLRPEVHLNGGAGTWHPARSAPMNDHTTGISVSIDGTNVRVTRQKVYYGTANASETPLLGRLEGNSIRASNDACTMVLMRAASSAGATSGAAEFHRTATAPPTTSSGAQSVNQPTSTAHNTAYSDLRSLPSPDGAWRGTYRCNASLQMGSPFVIDLKLHVTNGSATWRSVGPGVINGNTFDIAVSVVRNISRVVRTAGGNLGSIRGDTLTGQYDGATINATGRERYSGRDCRLALTRS